MPRYYAEDTNLPPEAPPVYTTPPPQGPPPEGPPPGRIQSWLDAHGIHLTPNNLAEAEERDPIGAKKALRSVGTFLNDNLVHAFDPNNLKGAPQVGSRGGNFITDLFKPSPPTPAQAVTPDQPVAGSAASEGLKSRIASSLSPELALPNQTGEVLNDLGLYLKALPRPGFSKPAPDLTNKGLQLMISGEDVRAAAIRNEAINKSREEKELEGLEGGQAKKQEGYAKEDEKDFYEMRGEYREENEKAKADQKWLREHQRVDPYERFRSNAGAGIFAAVGAALMATGAAIRKDNPGFGWTQQISNLLDREADIQIREIQNHRGTLDATQHNMKRILETSRDEFEAKMRFRNQGLQALNTKIRSIQHGTESVAVKERADQLIAANDVQMGKNIVDAGIRREGMESQEAVARLMAAVQGRNAELNYAGLLAGLKAGEREKMMGLLATINRPKIEAAQKLRDLYGRAMSSTKIFFDALTHPDDFSEQTKDTMSEAFTGSLKAFLEGTDRPGEVNEVRAFGYTLDPTKIFAKLNRNDPKTLARTMDALHELFAERSAFILDPTSDIESPMPAGSTFNKPPPKKAAGAAPAKAK